MPADRVAPFDRADEEEGIIALAALKPPAKYKTGWAKSAYELLCAADQNNDALLSSSELWAALETLPIRIASLEPKRSDAGALATFNAIKKADMDGNGSLNAGEMIHVVSNLLTEKKKSSRLLRITVILLLIILGLLGAIAGITFGVVNSATAQLPQATTTSESSVPAMTDGHQSVLATADNMEAAPLYLAPVLPYEALRRVKIVDVSVKAGRGFLNPSDLDDTDSGSYVQTAMHVVAVSVYSRTHVEFAGEGGRSVIIINGTSMYQDVYGVRYLICVADVQCSSLTIEASKLEGLEAEAVEELRAIGLDNVADYLASSINQRRRLGPGSAETTAFHYCNIFAGKKSASCTKTC